MITGVTLAVSESSATAARAAIAEAGRRGIPVACVINHRPALGGDVAALIGLLEGSDIVIGSHEDLVGLFGDARSGRQRLIGDGLDDREIVITDGARAATVITAGGSWSQPVPAGEVRNAAGAGDALAGAYLAARLTGRAPAEALAPAVAAASISVGRDGCAASYPSAVEVEAALDTLPERASAITTGA